MQNVSHRRPPTASASPTPSSHWRDHAACRGLDTSLFFPGQGESVIEAKQVCTSCPVRIQCADYALDSGQRFGIWGATTERDRRRERGRRRVAALDAAESVA